MIDLTRTRADLLAEIGAPPPGHDAITDVTDPRVLAPHARLLLRGDTRADLFPLLEVVLSERFASVPRTRSIRDLLAPLKAALGNAHKRGNAGENGKSISVELVLTRGGAVAAVTDEGNGFDPARVVRELRSGERYFTDFGHGFRTLDRAASTVTFENGGRTLLLGIGVDEVDAVTAPAEEDRRAFDAEWIRSRLSAELPELSRAEACRVAVAPDPLGVGTSVRYLLRVDGGASRPTGTWILTGRLHADADLASADFEAATLLYDALGSRRVRIPRPITRPVEEPRLVVYDFDPWMDFTEYLLERDYAPLARLRAERVGRSLAALHGSRVAFREIEPEPFGDRFRRTLERVRGRLPAGSSDASSRLESVVHRIEARAVPPRLPVPVHARFGFDCVRYGVDGSFYFYRFEHCRMSHPALDLGGFLADASLVGDAGIRREVSQGFLEGYASRRGVPPDLGAFVAAALLERLARTEPPAESDFDALLRNCERSLERADGDPAGI